MSVSSAGYVDDVPYAFYFIRELAPAWLDAVVTLSGLRPPSRENGFAWCELGCGQGVTAVLLAGTHPDGTFHAIDAMPEHIAHARQLRDEARVANLTLHDVDFAAALDRDLPQFDYMVAHGVYSWVDARARDDLLALIDRRLKPGGVAYVSYNAMPGWANDAPFQFLVREIAARSEGDSNARVEAAMEHVQALRAAGSPTLGGSYMATDGWTRLRALRPMSYFAHEFLPTAWQPRYVTQVRTDMASIRLTPAGSATIPDNFDAFVLTRAAREALAHETDSNLRELTRDYFLHQRFRRDVFVRAAPRIRKAERSERLTSMLFDLQRPASLVEYSMVTEAGRVTFDTRAARAIVATLARGPARLRDITADGVSSSDVLSNALALFAAGEIRPVGPGVADAGALNATLRRRDTIPYLAIPFGTALELPPDALRVLRDRSPWPDEHRAWLELVGRYETQRSSS